MFRRRGVNWNATDQPVVEFQILFDIRKLSVMSEIRDPGTPGNADFDLVTKT